MISRSSFLKSILGLALSTLVTTAIMFKSDHKRNEGVLVVGTSDDYPPYTFNENGKIVGFDIDLARAVADRLGKKICVKSMNFSILLLELDRGVVDLLAAGITPRKTSFNVKFTEPYIAGDPFIVISRVPYASDISVEDLFGKTVVVNEGYTSDFFLSQYPCINLVRLETVAEAILALKTGKAEFFVVAKTVIDPFFSTNPSFSFPHTLLRDLTESYAFVLSGKEKKLFNDVQKALNDLTLDGTVEMLKRKWNLL